MTFSNITPVETRIELTLAELNRLADSFANIAADLQVAGNPLWGLVSSNVEALKDAADLLENGY